MSPHHCLYNDAASHSMKSKLVLRLHGCETLALHMYVFPLFMQVSSHICLAVFTWKFICVLIIKRVLTKRSSARSTKQSHTSEAGKLISISCLFLFSHRRPSPPPTDSIAASHPSVTPPVHPPPPLSNIYIMCLITLGLQSNHGVVNVFAGPVWELEETFPRV